MGQPGCSSIPRNGDTHGRPHSDGSLSSVGAAKQGQASFTGWAETSQPGMDPGPFQLSRNKTTKCQGPTQLYLSLLGVCMVLCPLGRGWWEMGGETLAAENEVELEVLVVRSRPSCLMLSSTGWAAVTSFQSCWRSEGQTAVAQE